MILRGEFTVGFTEAKQFLLAKQGESTKALSSWWLSHPSEKYARQIGSSPQVGVKIKNIWVATT